MVINSTTYFTPSGEVAAAVTTSTGAPDSGKLTKLAPTGRLDWSMVPNAHNGQIVSVVDYGAQPDGTFQSGFDCTSAFQAAITYLVGVGGGTLVIPPGTWRITQPVKITGNGISVVGYGDASTIIMDENPANISAATPGPAVAVGVGEFRNSGLFQCWAGNLGAGNGDWPTSPGYSGLGFFRFRVLGNSPSASFDDYQSAGIDFSNNSNDCSVVDVTFESLRGFGVHARGNGARHRVSQCRAFNVGNSLANHGTADSEFTDNILVSCEGFEISGRRTVVSNNVLSNCSGIAMGGNPSSIECGSVCSNNAISDAIVGIYVGSGMSDCIVSGNTIMRTSSFGINVAPGAPSGPFHVSPARTVLVGNMLRDIGLLSGTGGTRHAIRVSDTTDVSILANTVITSTSTTRYTDSGIRLSVGADRTIIRGNTIDLRTTPTAGAAFSFADSAELTVEDNQVFGGVLQTTGTVTYRSTTFTGTTAERPTMTTNVAASKAYFNTTLNAPEWWNGTAWVAADAGGATPVNVTVAGDGTATTFTVTHNLALTTPFLPSSITVLDPGGNILSGSSYALSAPTANNFTVTFAVAPANAAVHTFRVTA